MIPVGDTSVAASLRQAVYLRSGPHNASSQRPMPGSHRPSLWQCALQIATGDAAAVCAKSGSDQRDTMTTRAAGLTSACFVVVPMLSAMAMALLLQLWLGAHGLVSLRGGLLLNDS